MWPDPNSGPGTEKKRRGGSQDNLRRHPTTCRYVRLVNDPSIFAQAPLEGGKGGGALDPIDPDIREGR
jgi:hypothetical protein